MLAAVLAASIALAGSLAPPVSAMIGGGSEGDERQEDSDNLRSAQVVEVVASAHAFLLDHQNADGSFSVVRGRSSKNATVAVTGLTALSLMAAGHLPAHEAMDRTRHGSAVKRAVDWLVDHCQDSGERSGYFYTGNDTVSRMHGQGYALLALTQAAGMYGDDEVQRARLHAAVQRGVDLVERTQGIHGGWWYNPERGTNHEGSITVCMIQALRAAKDAGFVVDGGVIGKAMKYMAKSQDQVSGKFRYAMNDKRTTWALTAAALATLNALGDYGSEELQLGFDALQRDDPYTGLGGGESFQWYGSFYAAQTYWAHRDQRVFREWWASFVAYCADDQWADGSFHHGDFGQVYATAMVSLTLQVPFGYLPLFQR